MKGMMKVAIMTDIGKMDYVERPIPTPKDDIDGSQVAQVYYGEHDLPRIAVYCEKDVVATAQVFLRLNQLPGIPPENVEHR